MKEFRTVWKRILGWKVGDKVRLKKTVRHSLHGTPHFTKVYKGAEGIIKRVNFFGNPHLLCIIFNGDSKVWCLDEKEVEYVGEKE